MSVSSSVVTLSVVRTVPSRPHIPTHIHVGVLVDSSREGAPSTASVLGCMHIVWNLPDCSARRMRLSNHSYPPAAVNGAAKEAAKLRQLAPRRMYEAGRRLTARAEGREGIFARPSRLRPTPGAEVRAVSPAEAPVRRLARVSCDPWPEPNLEEARSAASAQRGERPFGSVETGERG